MKDRTCNSTTRGWGHTSTRTDPANQLNNALLSVVDLGLAAVVVVAPLFFGGRHDLGRLVIIALIVVTAVAWFARQAVLAEAKWTPTAANGLLLLAIGLVGLQIVPLPVGWLDSLAPRNVELLPLWQAQAGAGLQLGGWSTLSLSPHETTKGLSLLMAYSLLFVVVSQRVQSPSDVWRLLRWVGVSAALMAGFGLLQYFTSNGRFFWFYEHPHRSTDWHVSGSFINRNHFASFLVLGVGPLAAWLLESMHERAGTNPGRRPALVSSRDILPLVLGGALATVLFAILLSLSRGGSLALAVAIIILGSIWARSRLIEAKHLWSSIGLAVVVIALLSLYGYDQVARRLNTMAKANVEDFDHGEGRRKIWAANVEAFRAGWMTGAGVGTHSVIYPVYYPESLRQEFTHAENGYLQVGTETGVVGLTLLLVGLGLCGFWCITATRFCQTPVELLCLGACASGLGASAVHSIVDFVWYIPACMSVTVILAVGALRLAQFARQSAGQEILSTQTGRPFWLTWTALVSSVGAWMICTFLGPAVASIHWDRYLRVSTAKSRAAELAMRNVIGSIRDQSADEQEAFNRAIVEHLTQVVAWDPEFARAHLRLTCHLVNEFERRQQLSANPMDVTQIRDAAMASKFASSTELRTWLCRAFGEDADLLYRALQHDRTGVALCPLQGEGYLHLAKLCFLEGGNDTIVRAYLDQALRIRPYDGDVLFEAGRQRLMAGDVNGAIGQWARCYRDPGPHQLRIVYLLAGRIPAAMFVETFQPDWQTLMPIWERYRQANQPDDLRQIAAYALEVSRREDAECERSRAAHIWSMQATMFSQIEQNQEALDCLEKAYAADPRQFDVRAALGHELLKNGQFTKAEPHLRWCLSRHPENNSLSAALEQAMKGRQSEKTARHDSNIRTTSSLVR